MCGNGSMNVYIKMVDPDMQQLAPHIIESFVFGLKECPAVGTEDVQVKTEAGQFWKPLDCVFKASGSCKLPISVILRKELSVPEPPKEGEGDENPAIPEENKDQEADG